MICKYCNTENQEGAGFCSSCGRRLTREVVCPTCGATTPDGRYCNFCGAPLETGRAEKTCRVCGTRYFGDRCPVCEAAVREPARGTPVVPQNPAVPSLSRGRKKTVSVFSVIGFFGIIAVLVFTVFLGTTHRYSGLAEDEFSERAIWGLEPGGTSYLYGLFAEMFSSYGDMKLIMAAVCLVMAAAILVMTCVSIAFFARSVRSGDNESFTEFSLMTYLMYVMFALMFRSLSARYFESGGLAGTFSQGISLNAATIAGLSVGGALELVCFSGNVARYGDRSRSCGAGKRYVLPLLAAIFVVFSAVCLSDVTVRVTESFASQNYTYETMDAYIFLLDGSVDTAATVFALVAQFGTLVYVILGLFSVCGLMMHAYNPGSRKLLGVFVTSVVFCAVTFLSAFLFAYRMYVTEYYYVFDASVSLTYLYVGFGVFLVGMILTSVLISKMKADGKKQDEESLKKIEFLNTH